jgi:hypothetical protein
MISWRSWWTRGTMDIQVRAFVSDWKDSEVFDRWCAWKIWRNLGTNI